MTFDEYVSAHRQRYQTLSHIVESILVAAIRNVPRLRLQQTQTRAKGPTSLRRKLKNQERLDDPSIELVIKDLAGCRLIFYTNSDVSRFLSSQIISNNFEVDWDRTKIHHPTALSSATEQFVSNNYVVKLTSARAVLPEYSSVSDLWCEVQVQTTLNHAWAETAHDTIYKKPEITGGFGASLMKSIERRMADIMRDHLLPAGYEFQKVLNDFERLSTGKELFDRKILEEAVNALNNNNRYDSLERFVEYVLPHYDDLGTVYEEILRAFAAIVERARATEPTPHETPFGAYEGHTALQISTKVADVVDNLRYLNIEATFNLYLEMFVSASSEDERNRWSASGERLTAHEISAWEKVGPAIQLAILKLIEDLPGSMKRAARSLLVAMLTQVFSLEVTGTTADFGSVTFKRGTIPYSKGVEEMRSTALHLGQMFFITAPSDSDKREALFSLAEATRIGRVAGLSTELEKAVLENSEDVLRFFTAHASEIPLDVLESIEHRMLWLYRHTAAPGIGEDRTQLDDLRLSLRNAIRRFSDLINTDRQFVIFKTLVGFESVFPPAWEDYDFDIAEIDSYRSERIDEFIDEISESNAPQWLAIVRKCAMTKSNDLATFPKFGEFLEKLAKLKPLIALGFFQAEEDLLAGFLPALIRGWREAVEGPDIDALMQEWVLQPNLISAVVWSFRATEKIDESILQSALTAAIKGKDQSALRNIISVASSNGDAANADLFIRFALPAIRALVDLGEYYWTRVIWGTRRAPIPEIDSKHAKELLDILLDTPRVDWHEERILKAIAHLHPRLVIDFFAQRLERHTRKAGYEAIPFQFHDLSEVLLPASGYLLRSAIQWYQADSTLFQYRGGRLVHNVFRSDWPLLEAELRKLVKKGDASVTFVARLLHDYEGEKFLYPFVKDLIALVEPGTAEWDELELVLDQSGVVSGEFGFVQLYQTRRSLIEEWVSDERMRVREFAEKYVRNLDRRIAAEQRRAEEDYEIRKRDWGKSADDAE